MSKPAPKAATTDWVLAYAVDSTAASQYLHTRVVKEIGERRPPVKEKRTAARGDSEKPVSSRE